MPVSPTARPGSPVDALSASVSGGASVSRCRSGSESILRVSTTAAATKTLPDTTQDEPKLVLSFPDANGSRTGRVGFSPKEGAEVDGIRGPIVVVLEAKGSPGAAVDGQLKRLTTGSGRALVARCVVEAGRHRQSGAG